MTTHRFTHFESIADLPSLAATALTESQWVRSAAAIVQACKGAEDTDDLVDMILGPRPVPAVAVAHHPAPQRRRGSSRLPEVSTS